MRTTGFLALSLASLLALPACATERGDNGGVKPSSGPTRASSDSAAGSVVVDTTMGASTNGATVSRATATGPTASGATAVAGPRGVATIAKPGSIIKLRNPDETPIVRALYVNRFAAQSGKKMRKLIGFVDSTELNALVIDMKDEFGLNFPTANPDFRRNAGSGRGIVSNVKALTDTLHAHNIFAIARIVTFKDPVAAQANPDWNIRRTDGSVWRDKQRLPWVNAYNHQVQEYNLGVAEELVKLGFDEIQWDYIRFPEPYKSLPQQVFPGSNGVSKPNALAAYLKVAKERLNKAGVRSTADIFGLVTTVKGALEVGQDWEKLSPVTDVLLPMVYPSHYPHGSFGIARPNAEPYKIIKIAIDTARIRDHKLGVTKPEHVRPWLQAFSLGQPKYDASHMKLMKQAVYDSGYDGWVLWSPGSNYDIFMPAMEKTLEPRKKQIGTGVAAGR